MPPSLPGWPAYPPWDRVRVGLTIPFQGAALSELPVAWTGGDRKRALELVPERLLRETFLFGPYEEQRDRLAAFADAGIGTAVVVLLVPPSELAAAIKAFAPA